MIEYLDMRTMLQVGAMVCLTLALIMTYYSLARKTYQGFQYWTSGIVCIGIGAVLVSMQKELPDFVSIIIGNFLIIIMPFLLTCGIKKFLNIEWKLTGLNIAILILFLLTFAWLTYINPSLPTRIICVNFVMAFFFAQALYISIRHTKATLGKLELTVIVSFSAATFSSLFRSLLAISNINKIEFIYNTNSLQSFSLLMIILSVVACASSLLILNSYRMENDLKEAYLKIEEMANTDDLCKIYNRRFFNQKIIHEFKRSQRANTPISLLMIDVDCFKLYNDKYGHQAGDQCLSRIACILKESVRRPSDITARYGGEEFVVLLPNTSSEGAATVAETIQNKMKETAMPHTTSTVINTVTLSIGIATVIPDQTTTPELLIKHADKSLYKGKQNGKNQIQIHTEETIKHKSHMAAL